LNIVTSGEKLKLVGARVILCLFGWVGTN